MATTWGSLQSAIQLTIAANLGYYSYTEIRKYALEREMRAHEVIGTFSRDDFTYDHATDTYRCPAGKTLQHYRRRFTTPRTGVMKDNSTRYRASKLDCQACPLKPRCRPRAPERNIPRSIYEGARDLAREIAKTEAYQ